MHPSRITFWLNDRLVEEDAVAGTTTLLRYLRDHQHLTGTKEGCAEGDCGACTVAVVEPRDDGEATFRAVNACILFLPMLQGKRVYTVEALRDRDDAMRDSGSGFHPAQKAMVERRGSQCGYCTPGIVMSLFEATYRADFGELSADERADRVDDQLCGNLCRCTGYRPIREAGHDVAGLLPEDRFRAELRNHQPGRPGLAYEGAGRRYFQPTSLDELFALRAEHPDAVLVAGGTDLGLQVTKRHADFPVVIGLEGVGELRELRREGVTGTRWHVGAGVSLTRLGETLGVAVPGVAKMMRVFGSRQIRSRATVGGNLCNASPIGDTPPMWLALDATAVIAGPDGLRHVPLSEFFTGYRQTALVGPEILLGVAFDEPAPDAFFTTYKVSRRRELDISTVAAGMYVDLDGDVVRDVRLAYGGVAATPVRAPAAERALRGQPWTLPTIRTAMDALASDFTPISDHRGSARYRTSLARNLLHGFFLESAATDRDRVPARPTGTVLPA